MSLYHLQKFLYVLNRDESAQDKYRSDLESLLGEYDLSDEEAGALRDGGPESLSEEAPSQDELRVALLLQQIWFASMVGWSAKLHGKARVVEQVREAAELLLAGAETLAKQQTAHAAAS